MGISKEEANRRRRERRKNPEYRRKELDRDNKKRRDKYKNDEDYRNKIILIQRKKYLNDREKILKINKKSFIKHKEKILLKRKNLRLEKIKNDPQFIVNERQKKKNSYYKNRDKIIAKHNYRYKNEPEYRIKILETARRNRIKRKLKNKMTLDGQIKIENQREKNRIYTKTRRKTDPKFKLRNRISSLISSVLRKNFKTKENKSCINFLPFTFDELKQHLELQFKLPGNEWMNWNNHGTYITGGPRVWHIDHIIPQNILPYDSLEHPNFKRMWSLKNLRALDAFENISRKHEYKSINDLKIFLKTMDPILIDFIDAAVNENCINIKNKF